MKQKIITRTIAVAFSIITSIGAAAQGVAIGDKDFTPNAAATDEYYSGFCRRLPSDSTSQWTPLP